MGHNPQGPNNVLKLIKSNPKCKQTQAVKGIGLKFCRKSTTITSTTTTTTAASTTSTTTPTSATTAAITTMTPKSTHQI